MKWADALFLKVIKIKDLIVMDINLPLILMVAVAVTGVIWLWDVVFLAKPRKALVAQVENQFSELSDTDKDGNAAYKSAIGQAKKEPVFVEYSKSFFPILAIVFILRSFLIEPFKIPSESMVPTLEVGDFIAVNKFAYGIRLPVFRTKIVEVGQPSRGDVVVFFPPHESRYFIKRLIGMPGDVIEVRDNVVYVNGNELQQTRVGVDPVTRREGLCRAPYTIYEETVDGKTHSMRKCPSGGIRWNDRSWVVPEGEYFMMGDNRDNSQDSRVWGTVPDSNIVGKAFAIWMHWNEGLPTFARAGSIE